MSVTWLRKRLGSAVLLAAVLLGLYRVWPRHPAVWHVDAGRPNDRGDGRSWPEARRTLQSAVADARAGDTILVTNGIYGPIRTGGKRIAIRSVNGPDATILDGGGSNRCALLTSRVAHALQVRLLSGLRRPWFYYLPIMVPSMGMDGPPPAPRLPAVRRSVLEGFTLRNGRAPAGGGAFGGTLKGCVIADNEATYTGGGTRGATLLDCTIRSNRAGWLGGGAWGGTLSNCLLEANLADFGGGAWGGRLHGCTVRGNQANCGGGVAAGNLQECAVVSNVAWKTGSGAYGGWLARCTLDGNTMGDPKVSNVVVRGSIVVEEHGVREAARNKRVGGGSGNSEVGSQVAE